jgi:hypothetical protein
VHSDADSILGKTRLNGSGGLDHLTGNGEALWQLLFLCEPLERGKTASSCADFNFARARALLVALLDNRQVMEESMSKDRSSQVFDRFAASLAIISTRIEVAARCSPPTTN